MFHLAALLSTRCEFTPMPAHEVNVEGTLNLLEFAQKEGESHGRPVKFLYPSSIAAFGLPDLATKQPAGRVRRTSSTSRRRCTAPTSSTASTSAATTRGTTSNWPPRRSPAKVDFRVPALPGADLGGDGALGRHVRLRAGDDPRRRARRSRTRASCGPTRASRSWRCPTRVEAILRLAERRARTLTRTIYNVAAFDPTAAEIEASCARRSRGRRRSRRRRSGRASSTRGRPTWTTRRRATTGALRRRYDFRARRSAST